MKILLLTLLILFSNAATIQANAYYELVNDNLKPAQDEFYVNGILGNGTELKASIARSKNKRAGELYTNYILYGVGDHLSEDFVISEIDPIAKQVIIDDCKTKKHYSLQMSYGQATSRLVLMKDYKQQ
jgi:hypothetical protein